MEWVDGLNETIRYIEDHLTEDIDYARLGQIACCSAYHYQRMFAYMAGMPLSEYIRRRRMSLAAVDLLAGARVLDVALRYGYQSPTAFNRAFQAVHGAAPSAVREPGVSIKSFPPLRFTIMIKGAEEMEYRIEQRESFRIVGVSAPIEKSMEDNFQTVPQLWDRVAADGTMQALCQRMNSQPVFWGSATAPTTAPGATISPLPARRRRGSWRSTPSPPPSGPSSPGRGRPSPSRSWSAGS